jgi:TRAP-type mannitol/chloroaromatic compound transport system substrate-binding protein
VTLGLLVNLDEYDRLPLVYQRVLQTVCGETFCERLAAYDAANPPALQRLVQDHGVIVSRYSDDVMEAAWRESHAYLEELSASNPEFGALYESYRTFRDAQWAYASGNELTYQQWVIQRLG